MPKIMDPTRLDAGESAFFRRQLEYIKARTYDTKQRPLRMAELLPVSTEAPSGADTITFRRFTGIGIAKIISDYSQDLPRVDVYGEEETVKVKSIGTSFGYSIKEIRRAQMAGVNLDQKRSEFAMRANDEKVNRVAWDGDAVHNIQGFIDYPGISEYTVPNDGTGTTKTWTTKTSLQIVRDLNGLVGTAIAATNGVERPDAVILPLAQYQYIAGTPMSVDNAKTILQFFLESNPWVKSVEWLPELDAAGGSGTDRMMAYVKDPEHVTLEIPQVFEQFEPQPKGLEFVVPCHSECAGVIVYYPLAVVFGDGI
jgi:hypothetical protein